MTTENEAPIALIVEDSLAGRQFYLGEFQSMGWEAVTALLKTDIEAAVRDYVFEVALLDACLPGVPVEALKEMTAGIPHIIVSADDTRSGYNVIGKNRVASELQNTVKAVLERDALRAQDKVRSRPIPEMGEGIVLEVKGPRALVQFNSPSRPGAFWRFWCPKSAVIKVRETASMDS